MHDDSQQPDKRESFADQAEQPRLGIVREFGEFLLYNKRWWLTPIVIVLLLVSLLVIFGGGPAGAFIYAIF